MTDYLATMFDLVHQQALAEGRVEEYTGPDGKTWVRLTELGRADKRAAQSERLMEIAREQIPLGSEGHARCWGCETPVPTHHVLAPEWRYEPACDVCAGDDLRVWQDVADIYNRLDDLFKNVEDKQSRQMLLDLVGHHAVWMANWRWDQPENAIEIQPFCSHDEDDDEDN